MKIWKPLTVENLNLAQRIFTSVGNSLPSIVQISDLDRMSRDIFESEAVRVYDEMMNGSHESEFILDVEGSYRCRMYVYPEIDMVTQEKFPNAVYSLGITTMNHYSGNKDIIDARFKKIEEKLLENNFPALLY